MEEMTAMVDERTREIVKRNLSTIRLVTIAGPLLLHDEQRQRATALLSNRGQWGQTPPLVMLAVHNDEEEAAAKRFGLEEGGETGMCSIVSQKGHNETVGNAIALYRQKFEEAAEPFKAKRHCLFLTRRGGKGKPTFVSPFVSGQGTTCGEWTRPVVRKPDGTVIKGFMKASVAVGFCPVGCPYCYLNMPYTDGMDVALNWEDLEAELTSKWTGYHFPINFGETSGLVEYDEWFASDDGHGSMVQFVIDACARANVTPFFLTKIRYPDYLDFRGRVQVGISLMPEPVREWLAPNGSPTDELLGSLATSAGKGAVDPVVRMTVIWQQREFYEELLTRCRNALGSTGWRLTLDILRFTPVTASIIANRYPKAARMFAQEIAGEPDASLGQLVKMAKREKGHVKKIRPPEHRQTEIFQWFRSELDRLGAHDVILTPCKGDPVELAPLARRKVIRAMPCACYNLSDKTSCGGPV